jgi:hypothetical protein
VVGDKTNGSDNAIGRRVLLIAIAVTGLAAVASVAMCIIYQTTQFLPTAGVLAASSAACTAVLRSLKR